VTVSFCIPIINEHTYLLLHSLACIWYVSVLSFGHFSRYVAIFHSCYFIVFKGIREWPSFICLFSICISSLMNCFSQIFFFFLVVMGIELRIVQLEPYFQHLFAWNHLIPISSYLFLPHSWNSRCVLLGMACFCVAWLGTMVLLSLSPK
jgi:hypothetical protein